MPAPATTAVASTVIAATTTVAAAAIAATATTAARGPRRLRMAGLGAGLGAWLAGPGWIIGAAAAGRARTVVRTARAALV
ncbi:MAG TPA: hypothetical protein VL241_11550, partial [Gemmatimonadales bacterium]|nr:hypothetical protein [Gemmatimonadales bacterium]